MVNLTIGFFLAPEVTVDTPLTFELIVNDGVLDSAPDTVQVMVRQVNRAPTAVAGVDLSVDERSTVTLAGSGSDADGDPISYAWSQVSGPVVTFSDATLANPQLTAHEVGTTPEVAVIELVTSDGTMQSTPSRINVTVQPVNRAPSVTIAPVTSPERETVTLTASATDPDGDALTWQWRQVSGLPVTLVAPTSASPTFVAPEVRTEVPLSFEVVVSDGTLTASATGIVTITDVNRPPVAVVGASREVKPGMAVELNASASSDPDGDALAFAWTQTGGAPVTLAGADTAVATFTMPRQGDFTFKVTVSDPANATGAAELTISAPKATGCGCTSSSGLFAVPLVLLALRRRRRAR